MERKAGLMQLKEGKQRAKKERTEGEGASVVVGKSKPAIIAVNENRLNRATQVANS